jgi:hypothetical protein
MKYIKKFEQQRRIMYNISKDDICEGDYVLVNDKSNAVKNFTNNNIGKVYKIINHHIIDDGTLEKYFKVVFENIPNSLAPWFDEYSNVGQTRQYKIHEIILHAKTKEELELKMKAKKYNIL